MLPTNCIGDVEQKKHVNVQYVCQHVGSSARLDISRPAVYLQLVNACFSTVRNCGELHVVIMFWYMYVHFALKPFIQNSIYMYETVNFRSKWSIWIDMWYILYTPLTSSTCIRVVYMM